MIFSILKAVLFGRKCTGIVTGYEIRRTYRGVDYYRYIVTANDKNIFQLRIWLYMTEESPQSI